MKRSKKAVLELKDPCDQEEYAFKLFLTDVPISSTVIVYPDSFCNIRIFMKVKSNASFHFRALRQIQVRLEERSISYVREIKSFTRKLQ